MQSVPLDDIAGGGIAVNTNKLVIDKATTTQISSRNDTRNPICPSTINAAVTAALTDSNHLTMTSEQQDTACAVVGAERAKGEWVLKGTIVGNADDRGNINTGVSIDLTGCTEIDIRGYTVGTGTAYINNNFGWFVYRPIINGTKYFRIIFADDILGYRTVYKGESSSRNPTELSNSSGLQYDNVKGLKISRINKITISAPASVTECDLKIYAR